MSGFQESASEKSEENWLLLFRTRWRKSRRRRSGRWRRGEKAGRQLRSGSIGNCRQRGRRFRPHLLRRMTLLPLRRKNWGGRLRNWQPSRRGQESGNSLWRWPSWRCLSFRTYGCGRHCWGDWHCRNCGHRGGERGCRYDRSRERRGVRRCRSIKDCSRSNRCLSAVDDEMKSPGIVCPGIGVLHNHSVESSFGITL